MNKINIKSNEQGFASLVIAMTLVTVLSLLTIGFSQLIRNETKQALNRQLSSQAYYAAEAGINDARQALNDGFAGKKDFCGPYDNSSVTGSKYMRNNNVDVKDNTSAKWSCLLIDTTPSSIDYSSIDTQTPTVFTARAIDASTSADVVVNSVTIAWQDADASNTAFRPGSGVANNSFPTGPGWGAPGMLRVGFTPLTSYDRDQLNRNTFTTFLYPNNSGSPGNMGNTTYSSDQMLSGQIVDGNCHKNNAQTYTRYCIAKITIPGGVPAGSQLFFNLRSIYSNTSARITINDGNARLVGAQSMIDSTGISEGVLKRIQVRVPTTDNYAYPGFSLESINGICKKLSAHPGFAEGCGY